jgi:hypothetical protein
MSGQAASAFKDTSQSAEAQRLPLVAPPQKVSPAPASAETGEQLISAQAPAADPQHESSKFFCGALTKKGTPCSRKVKSRGSRCYQHEGRPEAPPVD